MKLLSIAIPCYNSQAYMERCIESLLAGGDAVEIVIVDDGSTDRTGEIADRYAAQYPTIVRAIHQENGGHGAAVNAGIEAASGLFFKVVDSDDRVREDAYRRILSVLGDFCTEEARLDMLISNFVYDKEGARHRKVMHYRHALPVGRRFSWDEAGHMRRGKYILMHSVIFRTALLRESGMKLPEHTFYVDNLYVFEPMPHVKQMYYLDENFYYYYIGREDQSVHEDVMIRRIDQQLLVNRRMIDYYSENYERIASVKGLRAYMFHYLEIITTISSILLIRSGTKENLQKKKALWRYIKKKDRRVYRKLRFGVFGLLLHLPGRLGRSIDVCGYKISQRIYKFN